jgi:LacI family transcriptional regulator
MRVNIHEIAKKTGFSIATVSRAINDKGLVKERTRQKILQVAQSLNYKPHPIARSLSSKRTDTIGVVLPELVDEFFMELIHGIDEVAHENNRFIMVSSSHSKRNDVETALDYMNSGRVDGVILMAPGLQKEISEIFHKSRRPVVLINCPVNIPGVASFSINNYQGAFSIVQHLINHGYKKIGMIKGPDKNSDAQARWSGFRDALRKNNLEINPAFVLQGDFSTRSGYYGFTRLMNQRKKPEAIFAANDMTAVGIYEAATDLNINIPGDIAVAGFDDIFLSRLLKPRLTTVHVPIMELGNKAMNYLIQMIEGNARPDPIYKEELSTGLVIGESCGCSNGIALKVSHK